MTLIDGLDGESEVTEHVVRGLEGGRQFGRLLVYKDTKTPFIYFYYNTYVTYRVFLCIRDPFGPI